MLHPKQKGPIFSARRTETAASKRRPDFQCMTTWALILHLSTGRFLTVLPAWQASEYECADAAAAALDFRGVEGASCVEAGSA